MEPTIAISALAKLIGLGMKGWSAIESRGNHERALIGEQACSVLARSRAVASAGMGGPGNFAAQGRFAVGLALATL